MLSSALDNLFLRGYVRRMIISTLPDLKEAFGSYRRAALALRMTPQALHLRLGASGKLPATQYFQQKAILEGRGYQVEDGLWDFVEADQREAVR